ncbi:MAG: DNA polymerase III subunit beta [Minwuia sp.]|uniref:DNA polymerase III subunit beta n=1 Tax=Minwuia sp. TaxID=2493630 RepID=UPI003A865D14
MKLTIERAALLSSLGHVQSVVERRNTIPILSHVQIEAAGTSVRFRATDLELSVVEENDATVDTPGTATAPAHTLYDIVRKLPDGADVELTLETERRRLSLRSGRSEFALACLPNEDFPTIEDDDLPHSFEMKSSVLRRLVERTRFAISTEETRYYLNGVYLHASEDGSLLRAVATDGHRLARFEIEAPAGSEKLPGVIVPRKAIGEIHRLLADSEDMVGLSVSDTKIRFSVGRTVLTSKLIDGSFPDYERVIPTGNDKYLDVDSKVFSSAVDRVSTISTEKSRAVKLAMEGERLVLSANSPDAGSATEEIAVSYDAPAMEIGFNSRYLMEIAGQIDGDSARFELSDSAAPTIIRDPEDTSALYVLMPMRV